MNPRELKSLPLPRTLDVVIAAVLFTAIELEILFGDIGGPQWVAMLCGGIAGVSIAWRNVAPRTVMLIAVSMMSIPLLAGTPKEDGVFSVLPMLFAAFSLGQAHDRDQAGGPLTYATVAAALGVLIGTSIVQAGLKGSDGIYIAMFVIAPYAFGRAVGTSRRDSERHAERAESAIRGREAARKQAVAEERARIARELHDVIAHSVSLMGVQAGAARKVLPDGLPEIESMLRSIEETGRETVDEMRRLLGIMREDDQDIDALAPQPGAARIGELVEQSRATGMDVSLDLDPGVASISPGVDLVVYRIIQEALTNARRHGTEPRAEVRVQVVNDDLAVSVENPCAGGAESGEQPERGHGIIGMRERAALYGGQLSAEPAGNGRFVVRVVLPIDPVRNATSAAIVGG